MANTSRAMAMPRDNSPSHRPTRNTGARYRVSDELYMQAIEAAIKVDAYDLGTALDYCPEHLLAFMLPLLIESDLYYWFIECMVVKMMEKGVSQSLRKCVVQAALERHYHSDHLEPILSHCSADELVDALLVLIKRDDCNVNRIVQILAQKGSDGHMKSNLEEAFKAYTSKSSGVVRSILPHCSSTQLEAVLDSLVSCGLWEFVGKVLKTDTGHNQRERTILLYLANADDKSLAAHILPFCTDTQRRSHLTDFVSRGLLESVGFVLKRQICTDVEIQSAVEKGSLHPSETELETYLLPHIKKVNSNAILKNLVERAMWKCVCKVLREGSVDENSAEYALSEAFHVSPNDFLVEILPALCCKKKFDNVVARFVNRLHINENRCISTASDCNLENSLIRLNQLASVVFPVLVFYGKWSFLRSIVRRCIKYLLQDYLVEPVVKDEYQSSDSESFEGENNSSDYDSNDSFEYQSKFRYEGYRDHFKFWLILKNFNLQVSNEMIGCLAAELTVADKDSPPHDEGKDPWQTDSFQFPQYETAYCCIVIMTCFFACTRGKNSVDKKNILADMYKHVSNEVFSHQKNIEYTFQCLAMFVLQSETNTEAMCENFMVLNSICSLFP
jgi:hypothetical protein